MQMASRVRGATAYRPVMSLVCQFSKEKCTVKCIGRSFSTKVNELIKLWLLLWHHFKWANTARAMHQHRNYRVISIALDVDKLIIRAKETVAFGCTKNAIRRHTATVLFTFSKTFESGWPIVYFGLRLRLDLLDYSIYTSFTFPVGMAHECPFVAINEQYVAIGLGIFAMPNRVI